MSKTNIEIVQELLQGATKPEVVNALVSENATYVSLTFDNPDLTKIMPWAGTHKSDGRAAILKNFVDVNTFWTVVDFVPQYVLSDGDNVAVFGSFTLKSKKLGKQFTSPFSVLATVKNGQVTHMQYMEDILRHRGHFPLRRRGEIPEQSGGGRGRHLIRAPSFTLHTIP